MSKTPRRSNKGKFANSLQAKAMAEMIVIDSKKGLSYAFPPNIIYLPDAPSAVFHLPRLHANRRGYHIVQINFDSLKT